MAENAGARFYEGLRVTADHLRHMQDRLWEALGDLRLALGRGKIAWGLRAEVSGTSVALSPGVAFSGEGVRLAIDTQTVLPLPAGTGPFLLRLTPVNEDRASLQLGGIETYVTLRAEATVIDEAGAPAAPEALDIARIATGALSDTTTETGLLAVQDETLFIAAGHHGHSGEFRQDAAGRWSYDGPVLPGLAVLADQLAAIDAILSEIDTRLVPLEDLPAQLAALQDQALTEEDLQPLQAQLDELQGLVAALPELPDLTGLAELADLMPDLERLIGLLGPIQELVERLPSIRQIPDLVSRIASLETAIEGLAATIAALSDRLDALEDAGTGTGDGGLDPDWPMIRGSSWPHAKVLTPDQAAAQLTEVVVDFSQGLDRTSLETGGNAFQVWFEPSMPPDSRTFAQPILTLPGQARSRQEDQLVWISVAPVQSLVDLFKTGGRLSLRVHCGALMSRDGRAFSGSTAALTGLRMPPVPGGVMESWFLIEGR